MDQTKEKSSGKIVGQINYGLIVDTSRAITLALVLEELINIERNTVFLAHVTSEDYFRGFSDAIAKLRIRVENKLKKMS